MDDKSTRSSSRTVTKYGDIDLKRGQQVLHLRRTSRTTPATRRPKQQLKTRCSRRGARPRIGDAVKEVRASSRLADSPSVIVSDEARAPRPACDR